jgi:isoprenylcysteine carboxyl methyltransferase (ICMT) family protein YpbQ
LRENTGIAGILPLDRAWQASTKPEHDLKQKKPFKNPKFPNYFFTSAPLIVD